MRFIVLHLDCKRTVSKYVYSRYIFIYESLTIEFYWQFVSVGGVTSDWAAILLSGTPAIDCWLKTGSFEKTSVVETDRFRGAYYFLTFVVDAVCTTERSVYLNKLHSATSQKAVISIHLPALTFWEGFLVPILHYLEYYKTLTWDISYSLLLFY